jgi:hypothetical protein
MNKQLIGKGLADCSNSVSFNPTNGEMTIQDYVDADELADELLDEKSDELLDEKSDGSNENKDDNIHLDAQQDEESRCDLFRTWLIDQQVQFIDNANSETELPDDDIRSYFDFVIPTQTTAPLKIRYMLISIYIIKKIITLGGWTCPADTSFQDVENIQQALLAGHTVIKIALDDISVKWLNRNLLDTIKKRNADTKSALIILCEDKRLEANPKI